MSWQRRYFLEGRGGKAKYGSAVGSKVTKKIRESSFSCPEGGNSHRVGIACKRTYKKEASLKDQDDSEEENQRQSRLGILEKDRIERSTKPSKSNLVEKDT